MKKSDRLLTMTDQVDEMQKSAVLRLHDAIEAIESNADQDEILLIIASAIADLGEARGWSNAAADTKERAL